MSYKKPITIALVGLAVLVPAWFVGSFLVSAFSDYYTIASLDAGGATITVEAASYWEVSQGVCIRIAGPNCHVPRTFIGSTLRINELQFSILPLDGQSFVLVETHYPDVVLAIVQVNSNTSWPRDMSLDEARAFLDLHASSNHRFRLSEEVTEGLLN